MIQRWNGSFMNKDFTVRTFVSLKDYCAVSLNRRVRCCKLHVTCDAYSWCRAGRECSECTLARESGLARAEPGAHSHYTPGHWAPPRVELRETEKNKIITQFQWSWVSIISLVSGLTKVRSSRELPGTLLITLCEEGPVVSYTSERKNPFRNSPVMFLPWNLMKSEERIYLRK